MLTPELTLVLRLVFIAANMLHSVVGKLQCLAYLGESVEYLWPTIILGGSEPEREYCLPKIRLFLLRELSVLDVLHVEVNR